MQSNVPLKAVSMNPSSLTDDLTRPPVPRPPQEAGSPLEALDVVRNQLDTIRERQKYSNDAINDLLTRPNAHDVDFQGSVLDAIEGRIQTLLAQEEFHGRELTDTHNSTSQEPLLPGGGRSRRNDSAPHPVGIPVSRFDASTLPARSYTTPRPYVANPETRPRNVDQSIPYTGHSTRSTLTRQLHEILSQPDPLPALAVQHPPPLTSLTYEPAPKVRSASPVSIDGPVPRHIAFVRPLTPSQLRQFRARQQAEPVQRSAALEPQGRPGAMNHEFDTSPDNLELERELKRVLTQRLLAVDQRFASNPQQLGTSSHRRPRRRRQEPERGTLTNETTQLELRAREFHDRPSATLQGEGGSTHIAASRAVSAEPRQPPAVRPGGVAPAKPIRTTQPSSSWYRRPSRTQTSPQSRPQQTIVQFPPEPLNRAIELLQDIRLGQRAVAEQQREVTRYMRDLNGWLERAVHHRREELGEMDARLGRLQQDVRGIVEGGIAGITE